MSTNHIHNEIESWLNNSDYLSTIPNEFVYWKEVNMLNDNSKLICCVNKNISLQNLYSEHKEVLVTVRGSCFLHPANKMNFLLVAQENPIENGLYQRGSEGMVRHPLMGNGLDIYKIGVHCMFPLFQDSDFSAVYVNVSSPAVVGTDPLKWLAKKDIESEDSKEYDAQLKMMKKTLKYLFHTLTNKT